MLIIGQTTSPNVLPCSHEAFKIWDFCWKLCSYSNICPPKPSCSNTFFFEANSYTDAFSKYFNSVFTGPEYDSVIRVTCDCPTGLCGYGLNNCGLNWKEARVCNEVQTRKTMSSFDWAGTQIEGGQLMHVDGKEYREMQLGSVSSVGGSYGPPPLQAQVQICKVSFLPSPPFLLHIFLKPSLCAWKWWYHTFDLWSNYPLLYACLAGLLQEQAQPYLLMIYLRKTFPSPTLLGVDRAAN